MCITVEERVEEEEEKICGQHFAFSGDQLQQAKRGSRGSCLLAPAPCHPPGSSLETCCHNPRGERPPKKAAWLLILKEI